ncbi:MAG: hypothetical protein OQL06_02995, partial [Gammaproteobacteria bacterium]|nr:hypothetical protein [Gammaproteobacteria bacterium]
MIKLSRSLNAWDTPDFTAVLKQEVAQLDTHLLPLQQGLSQSSYVSDKPVQLTINNMSENSENILIKTGIFYSGIIAG